MLGRTGRIERYANAAPGYADNLADAASVQH
jgi:hypothetical protein